MDGFGASLCLRRSERLCFFLISTYDLIDVYRSSKAFRRGEGNSRMRREGEIQPTIRLAIPVSCSKCGYHNTSENLGKTLKPYA